MQSTLIVMRFLLSLCSVMQTEEQPINIRSSLRRFQLEQRHMHKLNKNMRKLCQAHIMLTENRKTSIFVFPSLTTLQNFC